MDGKQLAVDAYDDRLVRTRDTAGLLIRDAVFSAVSIELLADPSVTERIYQLGQQAMRDNATPQQAYYNALEAFSDVPMQVAIEFADDPLPSLVAID